MFDNRTLAASLGMVGVMLLACGCDAAGGEPSAPDGEPSAVVVASRTLLASGQAVYLVEASELPAGAWRVEWRCGDATEYVDSGIAIPEGETFAIVWAPPETEEPLALPELAAYAATVEQHEKLYADAAGFTLGVPNQECLDDPDCPDDLPSLLGALDAADDQLTAAAGQLLTTPLHPPRGALQCAFRLVLKEGGGTNLPAKANPSDYGDWSSPVTLEGDPCQGMTPQACYSDRIERWSNRMCGLADEAGDALDGKPSTEYLPFLCPTVQSGWADYPPVSSAPLGSVGTTTPTTHAEGGVPEEPGNSVLGRRSIVAFDWDSFLRGSGSYSTFVHEHVHVDDFANGRSHAEVTERFRQEANAERQSLNSFDPEESERHAQVMAELARLNARLPLDRLHDAIGLECRAYTLQLELSYRLLHGPPRPAGKGPTSRLLDRHVHQVATYVEMISAFLDSLKDHAALGYAPDDAIKDTLCDCLDDAMIKADRTPMVLFDDDTQGPCPTGICPTDQVCNERNLRCQWSLGRSIRKDAHSQTRESQLRSLAGCSK